MRLAIVHYHLHKGGVTRVIESAVRALRDDVEKIVILASNEPGDFFASQSKGKVEVRILEELAYCRQASLEKAVDLKEAMLREASAALGGLPDVWHIHNHSLGKNANFPEALHRLLETGARVLLQIHDFAEDGRAENFKVRAAPFATGIFKHPEQSLYPVAPQIAYGVLNGRDRGILSAGGIPETNLFFLPNAVTPPVSPGQLKDKPVGNPEGALILYPTRAIRRKNIGELLLLAATHPTYRFATTLTPENPVWQPVHDKWRTLSRELDLPVAFGIGEQKENSFADLLSQSTAMVTTSVAEGFGLAFLEPWLIGRPILGRDLPEITSDFRNDGVCLDSLYETWKVPLKSMDSGGLKSRYLDALNQTYSAYGRNLDRRSSLQAFEKLIMDGMIDFGRLDETAQEQVLRYFLANPREMPGPCLVKPGTFDPGGMKHNLETIRKLYGLGQYKDNLLSIYRHLLGTSPGPLNAADPDRILAGFLEPSRFCLLRS